MEVDRKTWQREDEWLYFNMLLVTFGLCMQIYATLPFSGCSLLKATGNFSSVSPPILHFTRSSTHFNVRQGGRLEGNWIKSNPPKLHGAQWKGICYLTPALHLISSLPAAWRQSATWWRGEQTSSAQHRLDAKISHGGANLVRLHLVHLKCFVGCFFFTPSLLLNKIRQLEWQQMSTAGRRRKEKAALLRLGLNWYSSRGVGIFKCQ